MPRLKTLYTYERCRVLQANIVQLSNVKTLIYTYGFKRTQYFGFEPNFCELNVKTLCIYERMYLKRTPSRSHKNTMVITEYLWYSKCHCNARFKFHILCHKPPIHQSLHPKHLHQNLAYNSIEFTYCNDRFAEESFAMKTTKYHHSSIILLQEDGE